MGFSGGCGFISVVYERIRGNGLGVEEMRWGGENRTLPCGFAVGDWDQKQRRRTQYAEICASILTLLLGSTAPGFGSNATLRRLLPDCHAHRVLRSARHRWPGVTKAAGWSHHLLLSSTAHPATEVPCPVDMPPPSGRAPKTPALQTTRLLFLCDLTVSGAQQVRCQLTDSSEKSTTRIAQKVTTGLVIHFRPGVRTGT